MDSIDNLRERLEALEHQTHTLARQARWWRGLACGIMVLGLLSGALPSGQTVDAHRRDLSARVAELEDKLQFVTISEDEMVITRANLRIVNGLGKTDCGFGEEAIPNCPNGLGNLIVGYNEERESDSLGNPVTNTRTGSHNVVVGANHNFSRFGGIVVGNSNEISGDFASVSGGFSNTASGYAAAVNGGQSNRASGFLSAVSGGYSNRASGYGAAVSGGGANQASGNGAAVSGGSDNTASGSGAAVSGGFSNTASGILAAVSGGTNRSALETHNWAAGSLLEAQ